MWIFFLPHRSMAPIMHASSGWRLIATVTGMTVLLPLLIAARPASSVDAAKQKLFFPANFRVEIDGTVVEGIKEVSGIESELEVIEYRNGDDPITHKRPGRVKYGDITLKRGFVKDDALRAWYKKVLAGTTERKSASIIYLDRAGNEVMRYNLFEAWPCRWKAPELSSKGDTTSVESIDVCAERIERL